MKIAGVEITHSEKIIFPSKKITKGDMAKYYEKVGDFMLPYLRNRPLTLKRFPAGIKKEGFYQKNASDHFPKFIKLIKVETEDGINTQILCNNKKSLIYLVNQNTLAFHIWLSRKDKIRQPDKIIFDLDPPKNSFAKVKEAAKMLRIYLKKRKIEANLMTTGQNGLHVYYDIRRGKDFEEIKMQVRKMAEELVDLHPDLLTTKLRKDQREGKIFVDYLRNAYAQTAICPYSLRSNREAGIATPIKWEELDQLESATYYNFSNILDRIKNTNK